MKLNHSMRKSLIYLLWPFAVQLRAIAAWFAVAAAVPLAVTACGSPGPSESGGVAADTRGVLVTTGDIGDSELVTIPDSTDDGSVVASATSLVGAGVEAKTGGDVETDWFTNFNIRPQALGLLDAAVDYAIVDCMKAKGFQVSAPPVSEYVQVKEEDAAHDWRFYPLDSSVTFEEFVTPPVAYTPGEPSKGSIMGADSDAASKAISGTGRDDIKVQTFGGGIVGISGDGCFTEARKHVYDDLKNAFPYGTIMNLRMEIGRGASEVEPLSSAFEEWQSCMQEAGYEYKSFHGANQDGLTNENPKVLYDQILLCNEQTDLPNKYKQAFNIVADQRLGQIENEYQTFMNDLDEIVRNLSAEQ